MTRPIDERASDCPTCGMPVVDGPEGGLACSFCYDTTEPPARVSERRARQQLSAQDRYRDLRDLVRRTRESGAFDA